jgi:hypothetical protein
MSMCRGWLRWPLACSAESDALSYIVQLSIISLIMIVQDVLWFATRGLTSGMSKADTDKWSCILRAVQHASDHASSVKIAFPLRIADDLRNHFRLSRL